MAGGPIEHMAAWIASTNNGTARGLYSFEALGEDLPAIKAASLTPPEPEGEPWAYGWTYDSCGYAVIGKKVVTETAEPDVFLANVFARGPVPLFTRPAPGISAGVIALTVHQALSEHSIDVSFHVADAVAQAIAALLQHEGREHG